jgi:hypothetical protein
VPRLADPISDPSGRSNETQQPSDGRSRGSTRPLAQNKFFALVALNAGRVPIAAWFVSSEPEFPLASAILLLPD